MNTDELVEGWILYSKYCSKTHLLTILLLPFCSVQMQEEKGKHNVIYKSSQSWLKKMLFQLWLVQHCQLEWVTYACILISTSFSYQCQNHGGLKQGEIYHTANREIQVKLLLCPGYHFKFSFSIYQAVVRHCWQCAYDLH